jgi:hypothetical protein
MRSWLARACVVEVSGWIHSAYGYHCRDMPRAEQLCARIGLRLEKVLFPVARRLDKEAMVDQMVHECWWG